MATSNGHAVHSQRELIATATEALTALDSFVKGGWGEQAEVSEFRAYYGAPVEVVLAIEVGGALSFATYVWTGRTWTKKEEVS
jgi:hypothetical protein